MMEQEIKERPFITLTFETMASQDWRWSNDAGERHAYYFDIGEGHNHSLDAGKWR